MAIPIDKVSVQTLKPVIGEDNTNKHISCLVSFEPASSVGAQAAPLPLLLQIPGCRLDPAISQLSELRHQLSALAGRR